MGFEDTFANLLRILCSRIWGAIIMTKSGRKELEMWLAHKLHMEGLRLGFYVSALSLILATVLGLSGSELFGTLIGAGGVIGLAGTFVYGAQGRRATGYENDFSSVPHKKGDQLTKEFVAGKVDTEQVSTKIVRRYQQARRRQIYPITGRVVHHKRRRRHYRYRSQLRTEIHPSQM